jgi:hypothetical protein
MVVLSVIVAAAFADVVLSGVLTGSCARVRDGRERRAPAPRRPRARRGSERRERDASAERRQSITSITSINPRAADSVKTFCKYRHINGATVRTRTTEAGVRGGTPAPRRL